MTHPHTRTQVIDLRKLRAERDAEKDVIDAPEFDFGAHSGRAVSDERGNMIWEWQTAPGVYSREVTPQQLHRLSMIELELLEAPDLEAPVQWRRERLVPRNAVAEKSSAFDFFVKKLGLPA